MKEEATINNTKPQPSSPIKYKFVGSEPTNENIKKSIPKSLIPTKRVGTIFGGLFVVILLLSLFQLPISQIIKGKTDIIIKIGFPWSFLEFNLSGNTDSPVQILALIADLILYIILAYAIDISTNLILKNPLLKSKEEINKESEEKPAVFKNINPSIAEKVTKKILEEKSADKSIS